MLRSMLYVRYGSGCSRRVTASAAVPSATRSCDSSSRSPSSGVKRSPATAFSSSGAMAEDKVDPSRSEFILHGELVEPLQPPPFGRPQSVIEVFGEVIKRRLLTQIEQRRFPSGDCRDVVHAAIAG